MLAAACCCLRLPAACCWCCCWWLLLLLWCCCRAAAPAAVVVRNKSQESQEYYSLARSPLRLPGSANYYPAACCLLLPAAPPCIGRGQRIIIILHKLFFPGALPLASAGVGGYNEKPQTGFVVQIVVSSVLLSFLLNHQRSTRWAHG